MGEGGGRGGEISSARRDTEEGDSSRVRKFYGWVGWTVSDHEISSMFHQKNTVRK